MIGFMRFRGIDYINSIRNLIWFCKQFKYIVTVWHDKTGLGEVMDDALSSTELPYHGVIFTNKSKSEMVNNLMLAFQRRVAKIPHWTSMIDELDAYECSFSDVGNMRYAAGDGFHDDIVSSMFLGWQALTEFSPTAFEVVTLDQLDKIDLDGDNLNEASHDFETWKGLT
jgi:hypothetical protein